MFLISILATSTLLFADYSYGEPETLNLHGNYSDIKHVADQHGDQQHSDGGVSAVPEAGTQVLTVRSPSEVYFVHQHQKFTPSTEDRVKGCCTFGYRSEWLAWGRRRVLKSHCERSMLCCEGLVSEDFTLWGGFGYTLCTKEKGKPKEDKTHGQDQVLQMFNSYLRKLVSRRRSKSTREQH